MGAQLEPLLSFIRGLEAPKGYDQVWGGIRKGDLPPKPLTTMTVEEVLAWQDSIDPQYRSEAAGAYQILEDTLRGLARSLNLTGKELFNEAIQDRLAEELMKGRGLALYLAGTISAEEFCNRLAREWASLPLVSGSRKGQSYYGGDGLNRALTTAAKFLDIVLTIKTTPVLMHQDAAEEAPAAIANIINAIASFLSTIFGGRKP